MSAEVAERKTRWTQDPVDFSSVRVQIPPSAPKPHFDKLNSLS